MSHEDREELIHITDLGDVEEGTWSFGRGYGDPEAGDRVYLLRTGKMRGIIASGTLIFDDCRWSTHWDNPHKIASYVDVLWDVMLDDDDRLPIEQLDGHLTGFKFPVYGSGRLIKDPADRELAKLWTDHIAVLRERPGREWLGAGGPDGFAATRPSTRIPLQRKLTHHYDVDSFVSYSARAAEAELVDRYAEHLRALGREPSGYRIALDAGAAPLFVDLLDVTDNVLYEAKGSTSREAIRMALGQLLDYRRHIHPRPDLAVLLPDRPTQDLLDLLSEHGVACIHENGSGGFTSAM